MWKQLLIGILLGLIYHAIIYSTSITWYRAKKRVDNEK
jgi:hypothetical protein